MPSANTNPPYGQQLRGAAVLDAAASGDNTFDIPAIAGQSIVVFGFTLSFGGTVNARFKDSNGNLLSSLYLGILGAQVAVPADGDKIWFVTDAGKSLMLNLSGAVAVGATVIYGYR